MIKHKDHFHGSDLEKIEEIYGIKKGDQLGGAVSDNDILCADASLHTAEPKRRMSLSETAPPS